MCVTICGRFVPNEGRIAGYVTWIWRKYHAKWGVQMSGMNFQTRSSTGGRILGGNGRGIACPGFSVLRFRREFLSKMRIPKGKHPMLGICLSRQSPHKIFPSVRPSKYNILSWTVTGRCFTLDNWIDFTPKLWYTYIIAIHNHNIESGWLYARWKRND